MDDTQQIVGTFSFEDLNDEGPQSGVITNFIGSDGEEVEAPHQAICWQGQILEGSLRGKWITIPMDDEVEWARYKLH